MVRREILAVFEGKQNGAKSPKMERPWNIKGQLTQNCICVCIVVD